MPLPPPSEDATATLNAVENRLRDLIGALDPEPGPPGRGRPRILPAVALWAGLVVCILHGFTSQLELWRLLTRKRLWDFPRFAVSDQAVYKRLNHGVAAAMQTLFGQVTTLLASRLQEHRDPLLPASFATTIVALDGCTLDKVARRLPALGAPPGAYQQLGGKFTAVFDILLQQWRTILFTPDAAQDDRVTARAAVAALPHGSLVLADLGYFGFAWFDWLTDHGYWWVSRLRAKTSYQVIHCYAHSGPVFDGLVWLGTHHRDQAAHAVRLVSFTHQDRSYHYITNVHDPVRLPLAAIAHLYARRWDIEMAFLHVKRHLGLHLLWSARSEVVQAQLWGVLLISQVLLALRNEVATRAGCAVAAVSLALLVRYFPRLAAEGEDPVAAFIEDGWRLGFLRPARRIVIRAPTIPPDELTPCPPTLVLHRPPRYACKQ